MSGFVNPNHGEEIVDKRTFCIELRKLYKDRPSNSTRPEWTADRIKQVIRLIEEYNLAKSQNQKVTIRQYHHFHKYALQHFGNETLLVTKKKSLPPVEIVASEDYYDLLLMTHKSTDHGGRDKMVLALKDKYYIPGIAISLFIHSCKVCQKRQKKSSQNKDHIRPCKCIHNQKRCIPSLKKIPKPENPEDIVEKEAFCIELKKFYKGRAQDASKPEWTTTRIEHVINLIEQYQLAKSKNLKVTNKQYHHFHKYELRNSGDKKLLFQKKKNKSSLSSPVIEIVASEDYYDLLITAHKGSNHGSRDKMAQILKKKYNIPIAAIDIFVKMCKFCLYKKNYLKKEAAPPCNVCKQQDGEEPTPELLNMVESGLSDERAKGLSDEESMAYDDSVVHDCKGPDLANTEEQHVICNSCLEPIDGFRYLCMECVKFEQCARCEAMRAHDHHYMLRVPGPRPEEELRAVATEVRAALASRPHLTTPQIVKIKVEQEIKYEIEIEAIEPDPLDTDLQPLSDHTTEYQEPPLQTGSFLGAPDCTTFVPHPPPPARKHARGVTPACNKNSNTDKRTLLSSSTDQHTLPRTPKVVTSPKDKSTCAKMLQKIMPLERKSEHILPKRKITSESSGTMPVPLKLLKREPDSADEDDTGDPGIFRATAIRTTK